MRYVTFFFFNKKITGIIIVSSIAIAKLIVANTGGEANSPPSAQRATRKHLSFSSLFHLSDENNH